MPADSSRGLNTTATCKQSLRLRPVHPSLTASSRDFVQDVQDGMEECCSGVSHLKVRPQTPLSHPCLHKLRTEMVGHWGGQIYVSQGTCTAADRPETVWSQLPSVRNHIGQRLQTEDRSCSQGPGASRAPGDLPYGYARCKGSHGNHCRGFAEPVRKQIGQERRPDRRSQQISQVLRL
jgi:hypothetical protein